MRGPIGEVLLAFIQPGKPVTMSTLNHVIVACVMIEHLHDDSGLTTTSDENMSDSAGMA